MSESTKNRRQRGITASVSKLQQALINSELKTQTAVAERIAELESLENTPRGLVNKVFRGEGVDPRSIERVAVALGVEAWTLYANTNESSPVAESLAPMPVPGKTSANSYYRAIKILVGIIVLLLLVLIVGFWPNRSGTQSSETRLEEVSGNAGAGTDVIGISTAVVVLPAPGDRGAEVGRLLAQALRPYWRILPASTTGKESAVDPQLEVARVGVDYVLEIRLERRGRWQDLSINLHQKNAMQTVWQGVWPRSASNSRLQSTMERAADGIRKGDTLSTTNREAQRKYLSGRYHLDQGRTPANLLRALTEFESAIRLDSQYHAAYAGLCEALVAEHMRSGEMTRLDEAAPQCKRALALAPGSVSAHLAQALLDRKSGRPEDSDTHYGAVLDVAPDNVDALLGLSHLRLAEFIRGEDRSSAGLAFQRLLHAAEVEPDNWKVPFQLARVNYLTGDLAGALEAASHAAELDANLLALSNLGTFQFCAGDFTAARETFIKTRASDPASFVGDNQLAAVEYNLGNFSVAVEGFKQALNRHRQSGAAEDHRLWGNYADALRHDGRKKDAIRAYATAIALVEQHLAGGDGNPLHDIARVYYQMMLADVDLAQQQPRLADLQALALQSENMDAIYAIYLAIVFQNLGYPELAEPLLEQGTKGCPGLGRSPDLAE